MNVEVLPRNNPAGVCGQSVLRHLEEMDAARDFSGDQSEALWSSHCASRFATRGAEAVLARGDSALSALADGFEKPPFWCGAGGYHDDLRRVFTRYQIPFFSIAGSRSHTIRWPN